MTSTRERPNRLARSIVSNWVTFVFSAVVNFVLSPIIVRTLGETQYGAWVLLVSMVGYLGLLDIGVRSAVTRYMAKFHAAADHESATRLYAAALRIFSIAAVVALLVSAVMAGLVGKAFQVPPELIGIARVVALLGGLSIGISLISGVYGGVLIGLERFDYNNGIEIVIGSLRAIGVLVALKTGQGLIGLALVQLVATIARALANVYYARRLYPELNLTAWKWDSASGSLIFKFGLSASLLHVSGSLMLYSDSLVIGAFLPIGMVTYFAIAGNLTEYARSVVSGISQTLTPRISALHAAGHEADLRSALMTNARLSTVVVLPIAATLAIRGASFIALWMGAEYAPLGGRILLVLSVTLATLAGYQVPSAAMFGISRHGGLIPVAIGEALCNLGLSIVLVRQYGVIGTAIGTMVPRMIVSILVGPWYVRHTLGISLRTFWTSVFLRPMIAIIPFAIASYVVERQYPAHNMATYFGQVALLVPVAVAFDWLICTSADERTALRRGRRRVPATAPGCDSAL
jgi:O-antigen/teichoic acid export membrane protein